jgi:Raf kinase inhibitor-like YbhB/YbcL family protein
MNTASPYRPSVAPGCGAVTGTPLVAARRVVRSLRYNGLVAGFALTSTAFRSSAPIPRRHTCDGDDVSPELAWTAPPAGTRSLALIVDDPDAPAGTFTHWVAWGIDPASTRLSEGERAPVEGRNDFKSAGWRGPCPPPGHGPHRYVFRLYALDAELRDLAAGAGKRDLEHAMATHVLGVADLVGMYER